jgi:glc operon protein GlcG
VTDRAGAASKPPENRRNAVSQPARILAASLVAACALAGAPSAAAAQEGLPTKPFLTLAAARRVAAAAEADAAARGLGVVVAVVDDSGTLLLLERLDAAQVASVEVAIGKARTAAIFRRPSKVFEDQIRDGRVAALALPGATALQGGLPLVHAGRVVGAIGVSGDSPQVDEDIARAGAAALP